MANPAGQITETFQQCDDCGGYFVKVACHDCADEGDSDGDPRREERRERAADDSRPASQEVAILPTSTVDGSYAYHEMDEDRPRCGMARQRDPDDWTVVSRAEAKQRGKAPCRNCDRRAALD